MGANPAGTVVKLLVLGALAAFFLLPVWVMLITGLKPFAEVSLARMWELPSGVYLDNFLAAWEALRPNLVNSVLLAVPAAAISAVVGSMNGYILSKWKFRGSDIVFTAFLFGMFIPYQSILIPLVQFMQTINLVGGIPGLILVHVVYGIPITTLIFRNYYATLPTEVIESGRIDGAGFFGIYRHLVLPLSIPGFAVVLIWQFTNVWNEFLFAIILTRPDAWPVTVALNNLAGSQIVEWNVQMAGALLAALPTLVIYV
ncbi:MAG TPA: carbohydrate ABC transporter permease, partial [Candidatus Limnocylindria bacterium]|nr:carbohydrate ABC transporter permease [Candidatus Limnocylindria bacterium]